MSRAVKENKVIARLSTNKTGKLFRHFIFNPLDYIQKMIIDSYNEDTGKQVEITNQQKDGIEAVRKIVTAKLKKRELQPLTGEEKRISELIGVSIMSGKGSGKDAWVAWIIMWFMDCFSYPKIPCTSVSAHQLSTVLWSEIAKWYGTWRSKNNFTLLNEKFFRKDVPKDIVGKRWFAFPKTANPKSSAEEIETLAGVHEDYVMVICDEVSGMRDSVLETLEGTLTEICNFMILIFNPTRTKGYAVDSQYKHSDYWLTLRWDAEDSPISDKANIERIKKKYGIDSNPYRVRVKGLPPLTEADSTIPWDWIEESVEREVDVIENMPVIKGMDCGAGGDYSIIATRKGHFFYPVKRNRSPDSVVLMNWAGNDIDSEKPDVFRVDTVGLGWAIEGGLREKKGAIVEAADSRQRAENPDTFYNKRAEMFWNLREAFERRIISIPNDADLIDSLGAIKHEYVKGRIKILDKKKIKEELGHSPDEADATALTYFRSDDLVCLNDPKKSKHRYYEDGTKASEMSWMKA